MVGPDVIPLPHIYGARIKGVEVFCPLDPPPPYEAVVRQTDQEQVRSAVSRWYADRWQVTQPGAQRTVGDWALNILLSSVASGWGTS